MCSNWEGVGLGVGAVVWEGGEAESFLVQPGEKEPPSGILHVFLATRLGGSASGINEIFKKGGGAKRPLRRPVLSAAGAAQAWAAAWRRKVGPFPVL